MRRLRSVNFEYLSSKEVDLRNETQVEKYFESKVQKGREIYVIHLAARVGGLYANMKDKVGFYEDNMSINMNVLKYCNKYGVNKVVSALSTCIFPDNYRPEGFPKDQNYDMSEDDIHKGKPHSSNEGYAYAKRMLEM